MCTKLLLLLLGKNSGDSTDWSTFLIANGNESHRAGTAEENARFPKVPLDLDLGVHSNVP